MSEQRMTADEAVEVGKRLHQGGKLAEAEDIYRRVLAAAPEHAEAIHFLGVLAIQRGKPGEAVELIRRADRLRPGNGGYLSNLGKALMQLDRHEEAIEVLQRACAARPDLGAAFGNLGAALKQVRRFDEAIAAFERALAQNPSAADALFGLGGIYFDLGDPKAGVELLGRAIAVDPTLGAIESARVFMMEALPGATGHDVLAAAQAWSGRHAKERDERVAFGNGRELEKRLRVGYVSADFREHSVGRFVRTLLKGHDRERVEVICYAHVKRPDAITAELRELSDQWRDIAGVSDDDVETLVRADGIDVLVDLGMHTAESRLAIFARRLAPVQVTYLAYCGTTGVEAMGYRISDALMDPMGMDESVYCEETVRLAGCYWCYEPNEKAGAVMPAPVEKAGVVTFGCLSSLFKVNADVLAVWGRILDGVPGSRLLLHAPEGAHRERIHRALGGRVEFVGRMRLEEYFACFSRVDIVLDTFPYAGGTTTLDALWMGVPVVTLAGQTGVGRGGVSVLTNIGAEELIARDINAYVRSAVELASDRGRLGSYRRKLRQKMRGSRVMDVQGFVKEVESAYRGMWREWCGR